MPGAPTSCGPSPSKATPVICLVSICVCRFSPVMSLWFIFLQRPFVLPLRAAGRAASLYFTGMFWVFVLQNSLSVALVEFSNAELFFFIFFALLPLVLIWLVPSVSNSEKFAAQRWPMLYQRNSSLHTWVGYSRKCCLEQLFWYLQVSPSVSSWLRHFILKRVHFTCLVAMSCFFSLIGGEKKYPPSVYYTHLYK